MNSKQKGNAGIGAAIAYFTKNNYNVLLPLTDSQDYDLVVDIDGDLFKVQVKFTNSKAPSGNYIIPLRSISGSSGKVYKTVAETDVDYLFCVTAAYNTYLMPTIDLECNNTITITKDFASKYEVI